MEQNGPATLRARHTAETREAILDTALELLQKSTPGFCHELIAKAAGMGARTVYRHFPDRGQLLAALWSRLRNTTNIRFPNCEEEIVPLARAGFQQFDEHESLIRALLNSSAGTEVREQGRFEGRPAFAQSLRQLLMARSPRERDRIIAVFLAVYSAPFWQLLRDRGGLTGPEVQEAVAWVLGVLLQELRRENRSKHKRMVKDEEILRDKQQKSGRARR